MSEVQTPSDNAETRPPLGKWMEADHGRLDDLWERATQSWPHYRTGARILFLSFRDGLLRHVEAEEEFMFPFFEGHGEEAAHHLTDLLREEHDQIRAALNTLVKKVEAGSEDIGSEETALRNVLWAHNTREEGVLYPSFNDDPVNAENQALYDRVLALLSAEHTPP